MNHEIIISNFLEEMLSGIRSLSVNDMAKLESGRYSISLKIIKNKEKEVDNPVEVHKINKTEMMEQLKTLKTRDAGNEMLSKHLKTKKELEEFARYLEVSVSKQDKANQIKEKIVEATIGAILRSNAIQGK